MTDDTNGSTMLPIPPVLPQELLAWARDGADYRLGQDWISWAWLQLVQTGAVLPDWADGSDPGLEQIVAAAGLADLSDAFHQILSGLDDDLWPEYELQDWATTIAWARYAERVGVPEVDGETEVDIAHALVHDARERMRVLLLEKVGEALTFATLCAADTRLPDPDADEYDWRYVADLTNFKDADVDAEVNLGVTLERLRAWEWLTTR